MKQALANYLPFETIGTIYMKQAFEVIKPAGFFRALLEESVSFADSLLFLEVKQTSIFLVLWNYNLFYTELDSPTNRFVQWKTPQGGA